MTACGAPIGARRKLATVREAAKLASWPNNGLRHSFASYRRGAIHMLRAYRQSWDTQACRCATVGIASWFMQKRRWKIVRTGDAANIVAFGASAWSAVIRIYEGGGDVIETHEHKGDFKEWWASPGNKKTVTRWNVTAFQSLAVNAARRCSLTNADLNAQLAADELNSCYRYT